MIQTRTRRWFLGVAVLAALVAVCSFSLPGCLWPREHVYLTWQGDTSTTMTVNYQTGKADSPSIVYYDTETRAGRVDAYRYQAQGASHQIPGLRDQRRVHTVELTGLTPGAACFFVAGQPKRGVGREHRFSTIPNDGSPIRFISGGDMGIMPRSTRLMKHAAAQSPMFAIVGGDWAYANGDLGNVWMWDAWLAHWERCMVTPDGAMIPMVGAIGNHEVNDSEGDARERAPFYLGYLAQSETTYYTRTFGPDLALFILDSGHISPYDGAQTDWLAQTMTEHDQFKFKMAVYHVPLYPSHRSYLDARSAQGRQFWLPLFDAHGLDIGFENHDHTFKRTKPLRSSAVDPEGTVYLGDGCFGVPPREIKNAEAPYLEKASSTAHFWIVEVNADAIRCRAMNDHGEVFDECVRPAR